MTNPMNAMIAMRPMTMFTIMLLATVVCNLLSCAFHFRVRKSYSDESILRALKRPHTQTPTDRLTRKAPPFFHLCGFHTRLYFHFISRSSTELDAEAHADARAG